MSIHPTLPRLSQIDPETFASKIRERVAEHCASTLYVRIADGGDACFNAARDAVLFAKGEIDDMVIGTTAVSILERLLYARAADGRVFWSGSDHDTEAGVVIEAAKGRIGLASKKAISCTQLAAIASLAGSMVRMSLQDGVLERERRVQKDRAQKDAPILASGAIRWLSSRGVKGFEKGASP